MAELAAGWEVWNEEPGDRLVLAYRPEVFDGDAFPAACLPTITVAPGRRPDTLPERRAAADGWYRAFYLEPTVRLRGADQTYDDWEAAVAGARALADRFVAGELDYRGAYERPRESYLAKLDDLLDGE